MSSQTDTKSITRSLKNDLDLVSISLEEVEHRMIDLLDVRKGQHACSRCDGREECPLLPPGMRLEIIDREELRTAYVRCDKDHAYTVQRQIDRLMNNSRLPKRFRQMTFDTFEVGAENEKAYNGSFETASGGPEEPGLILAGPVGTGKTHLACAILNHRIEHGREAVFCTVPELMADIRNTFGSDDSTSEIMDLVKDVDLLLLDDFGTEYRRSSNGKRVSWVLEQIWVIVNNRLMNDRQLIVTTNYETPSLMAEALGGVMGERIVSRLVDMCKWVRVNGEDRRLSGRRGKA